MTETPPEIGWSGDPMLVGTADQDTSHSSISAKSIDFIVAQEDGPESYYDRTEEHFDWPGGASGPTVGVGYDLGYVTRVECIADWADVVPASVIASLAAAVGLTGEAAHAYVRAHHDDVTISWDQAVEEFTQREVPKWEARMAAALPNWDLLSPDCAGALLSLGYNRGTGGFGSSLPRFREMNQIRGAMADRNWSLIPGYIRAMVRLWPHSSDLRQRRLLEARLFAQGIPQCQGSMISASTSGSDSPSSLPTPSPEVPST